MTAPGGSASLTNGFTYAAPVPTVASVTPNGGPAAGGTSVTITGTGFIGATAVTFGGTAATSFTVDSDTSITAITPAHAAGAVDVAVTAPGGSASLTNGFTYAAPVPTITNVTPATGTTAGGTSVTITGTNLTGATSVTFGGTPAATFTVDSATQITAETPARAAGTVDVAVTTPGGGATATDGFSFEAPVRPNPALDPEVIGLLNAQANTATRLAQNQTRNFHNRLEQLHNEGERRSSSMNVRFGYTQNDSDSAAEQEIEQMIAASHGAVANVGPGRTGNAGTVPEVLAYGTEGESRSARMDRPQLDRPSPFVEPDLGPFAVWSGGFVNFGERDSGSLDLDYTMVGVSGGIDYRFSEQFIGGFGVGYGRDRTDIGSNGTESRASAYSAAIYGSYKPVDRLFIDGLLGGSWLDFDSGRFVTANGEFATGSRKGSQLFGSLTTAYEFRDETWLISPYSRLEFSRSWLDGFTESGGGVYGLTYGDQTIDTLSGVLGIRANYAFQIDWGTLTPGIRAEYTHDFQGSSRASLGYTDLGGLPYLIDVDPDSRDYVTLGPSIDMAFENGIDLGLDYRTSFGGSGNQDHVFGLRFGGRF